MEKNSLSSSCELLVIGGSAGSMEVILRVLPALNKDLSFPIIILVHRKNIPEVSLSELLDLKTSLPVREVEEKDPLEPGVIYIAPSDYHLLIERDHSFSLDFSERVHYSRPSIDVTFESAADVYGEHLACLLLSGANADGVAGLAAVKAAGGITLVQDPATAEVAYMPQQALAQVKVDYTLHPAETAAFINSLSYNSSAPG